MERAMWMHGRRRLPRKGHKCYQISPRLVKAERERGSWKEVGLNPQEDMLFCTWEPMPCTPYISFLESFSWSAQPRFLSLPYMLISFFSAAWLELEFPMGRLYSSSPVSCPFHLTLLLIFSLALSHTLLSSSLLCVSLPTRLAQHMDFFIAGHW